MNFSCSLIQTLAKWSTPKPRYSCIHLKKRVTCVVGLWLTGEEGRGQHHHLELVLGGAGGVGGHTHVLAAVSLPKMRHPQQPDEERYPERNFILFFLFFYHKGSSSRPLKIIMRKKRLLITGCSLRPQDVPPSTGRNFGRGFIINIITFFKGSSSRAQKYNNIYKRLQSMAAVSLP